MFRRLGAEVTLVAPSARLLPREDAAVSEALAGVFRAEGIGSQLGKRVRRGLARGRPASSCASQGRRRRRAAARLTPARRDWPHAQHATTSAATRATSLSTRTGYVVVDERYETSEPRRVRRRRLHAGPAVHARVLGRPPRALRHPRRGARRAQRSERLVPYTVFTDPQVAGVGLSEQRRAQRGLEVEVATHALRQHRARHRDRRDRRRGEDRDRRQRPSACSARVIVGVDAGELIHVFSVLMQAGASARAIVDGEFVAPDVRRGAADGAHEAAALRAVVSAAAALTGRSLQGRMSRASRLLVPRGDRSLG